MDFDENYLDELLKSIEPIIGPSEDESDAASDEAVPDMPEEELDSDIAEPMDDEPESEPEPEPEPKPEPVAEPESAPEAAPAEDSPAVSLDPDPEDGNKQLSPDEIAAMFSAAGVETGDESSEEPVEVDIDSPELDSLLSEVEADASDEDQVSLESLLEDSSDEDSVPEPVEIDINDDDAILDNLMGEGPSLSDLLEESSDGSDESADETEQALTSEEIDAMLSAAENAGSEADDISASDMGDTDDLMSLLASAGDEDLGDIQNLLDSDENGEAVDEAALLAATTVEDVASDVLDTPEEAAAKAKEAKKAAKQKAKEEKKAAKAAKKGGKKSASGEAGEEGAAEGEEPKKGFFAGLLAMLTETVDDEDEASDSSGDQAEGGEGGEPSEVANISDENKEIMEELDAEQGKKKGKKAKKEKKKKKKGKDAEGEGEESSGEEGEEGEDSGKKKKKKERKKKEKAPKAEEVPSKPEKKLPKKRVRATFILCLSILAGIVIITLVFTKVHNLQEARDAYEKQDYQTTYEDLYGLELKGDDADIFTKSQIMLMLDRKFRSYQNYQKLGMEDKALNALLEGVKMYPEILVQAESYGVVPQVDQTYSQILYALAGYGLTEEDAKEIAEYDSKVKYTKRIDSIVHGTPFTYDEDVAAEGGMSTAPEAGDEAQGVPTVEDILPPETDFLPDDPNSIFDEGAPADEPPAPADEPGEIPADTTVIPTDEGNV